MELWDVLDGYGNKTGRTVERGKPMKQDEYHLVVHVWIQNSDGEFLITKRTPNKTFPNMWETTGGSAITGDNSIQAALREVKEETGIDLTPANGYCLFRFKRQHYKFPDFVDVWLFKEDIDINKVVYQPDEVCGAKWATPTQIRTMISSGEFVDFTYIEEIFNQK
ncbi:NUDIX hydrolase [Paenibacillus sp. PK3_47]|uniref:NUDIX hydrolase n=1 Tax=Paenibacillus sp. PK3_47 TaxID=2072642 RepID=UPI00201D458D|nr:NUDIX domain-containing protein [Paenibacillus sp. PK3_47]UQZ35671.1 NUDIX hydrolase [Paenibacillus sp. PK3_47]